MENNSAKQKPIVKNSIIAYALAAFLSLLLAPFAGRLYSWLFGVYCGGGILSFGLNVGCCFEGFSVSYFFFTAMAIAFLLQNVNIKKQILSWFIGIFIIVFLLSVSRGINYILISLFIGILGYLLGKIILNYGK